MGIDFVYVHLTSFALFFLLSVLLPQYNTSVIARGGVSSRGKTQDSGALLLYVCGISHLFWTPVCTSVYAGAGPQAEVVFVLSLLQLDPAENIACSCLFQLLIKDIVNPGLRAFAAINLRRDTQPTTVMATIFVFTQHRLNQVPHRLYVSLALLLPVLSCRACA